jgi:TatD DNase family protein
MERPVVLHQVGYREEFLRVLQRVGLSEAGGVVHGFGGDATWARALVSRGLLLGVGVSVTYESRKKLQSAVRETALDRLVLETDAPDQRPPGVKRAGVPADIVAVCCAVAELIGSSPEVVAETTYGTARALFRLPRD